jgi:hypothetical protein
MNLAATPLNCRRLVAGVGTVSTQIRDNRGIPSRPLQPISVAALACRPSSRCDPLGF